MREVRKALANYAKDITQLQKKINTLVGVYLYNYVSFMYGKRRFVKY